MTITYEWTRDDLKKILQKKRIKTNIIFLVLSILLYAYIAYSGFIFEEFDNWIILLGFLIYLICVLLLLFITTKWYIISSLRKNDKKTDKAYGIYNIILDSNEIVAKWNNQRIEYKWIDITKLVKRKYSFHIRTNNDKIGLTFHQSILGNVKYNQLFNYVESHINKKKV